jgi:hypothetical protein
MNHGPSWAIVARRFLGYTVYGVQYGMTATAHGISLPKMAKSVTLQLQTYNGELLGYLMTLPVESFLTELKVQVEDEK